jgi:ParB family transcriptional regulator, chromosome partitioning protein
MKLEFHQLDRRYEHLRVRNPERQRRLLASLAASGQQTPIVVVAASEKPDRYLVIDGYKRVAALEQLGRDTVEAVVWPMSEAEALVLDRSMRFSEQETPLEQGWLLAELERRFGYSLEDLARRFDRSVSWVSRRLALVEQLPEAVQQRVRAGGISAHVAMKYLAPVARANANDCQRMADAFSKYRFSSRQAGELYAAWRDASPSIRQRILDSPELFLKAQQQLEPQPSSVAEELLRDLTMVLSITNRAGRRLARAMPLMGAGDFERAQRKIECAVKDLTHLAERIGKEHVHVEPKSTDHDPGTARPGDFQARDRAGSEAIPSGRAESSRLELPHIAGPGPCRESRTLSDTDPGVVGQMQRQSGPGP